MFYSPLRYPGGKNKLAKFIARICEVNDIDGHYVEPYAGGASVALYLLLEKRVSEITINDVDKSIYAFWYSLLRETGQFCKLIEETDINIANWEKARKIQSNKQHASLLELGFSTFFLNRTNRSGIIKGGVIGGIAQTGKYKIDCRFNKVELINRITRIAAYKKKIHLYNLDATKIIKKIVKKSYNAKVIFYLDPPYYLKGKSLYINHYKHEDHEEISELVKSIKNIHWIVSYDNNEEIKKLYNSVKHKLEYTLLHSAYRSRQGGEILFFSNKLRIPNIEAFI